MALTLGAPRRSRRRVPKRAATPDAVFEIHTFVNNRALYGQMRESSIKAGFDPDAFRWLSDADDDPYSAITRIGSEPTARYPILCHQDVSAHQGAGATQLQSVLQQLDDEGPGFVAGDAGVIRSGRVLRRLVDGQGGSTGKALPLPGGEFDEKLLVFNGRNTPRSSVAGCRSSTFTALTSSFMRWLLAAPRMSPFPVTHAGISRENQENAYWRVYECASLDSPASSWSGSVRRRRHRFGE